jgi:hypothetical protein
MTLDADTVLWALRGMHDPRHGGVRADDVAHFMSQDATLSDRYRGCDVKAVLEALVAEGAVTHARGATRLNADDSGPATTRYRVAPEAGAPVVRPDAALPADVPTLVLLQDTIAELKSTITLDDARPDPYLDFRSEELERERDALIGDRDSWRQRAESSEQEVSRSLKECDDLRARVRELEALIEKASALEFERSQTMRRLVAAARDRLGDEPERHGADEPVPAKAIPRKRLRGNWLA